MADTPVDTVDAPLTEAAAEEKPVPKKKPAAKKATKKPAAKKPEEPSDKKPAKKPAAKKSTAKSAAKKTAERPADDAAAAATGDSAAPAVVFQPPEKKRGAKKAVASSDAAVGEDAPKDDVGEGAERVDEAAGDTGTGTGTGTGGEGEGEGELSASARRRRRRGGRRRRKPNGSGGDGNDASGDDEPDDDEAPAADDAAAADRAGDATKGGDAEAEGDGGGSSSSRRRRRRRREGENGEPGDDSGTVTKVRKARSADDEITAVSGSTRLEAKKQRRREGREAGRRRAPIVSEAEFLARREAVERVMVVRQRKDLTQIAVLEDKVLVEHYVARESQTSLIGNVYLGRVQNVLPSMEAAFIDIGKGRNAVLYAGEVNWSGLGHKEGSPRKIESVLSSGQTILVQVTKDPVGHKGARLTSQVSLAGRFLVYVPDGTTSGISRKLPDTERGRLKALLKDIVPETAGVIVRTAAEGASEEELTRDVERLKARWADIEAKVAKGNSPQLLYGEPDLTLKVVRDLFTEDFAKLVVQGEDAWETVHGYVEQVAPDLSDRLEHYQTSVDGERDKPDVFAAYRIDEQIAKGLDRKVWLPSGGSLVIDRTEAMTVVDVNTGKFTGSGGNLEETVTKNNLEAAEEIVRQLRLRDIGGIIVVDFIDMVLESNRDLVLRRLVECLGRDRTRHQVAEVTSLGLVQMTRKRIGTGLLEAFSETCDHCQGRGLVVHELPVEPRRGSGDDDSRRGSGSGRRRRGKASEQADEPAPKAVPSPKDVAAMAKPPAPETEEETAPEGQPANAGAADAESTDAEPVEAPEANDAQQTDAEQTDAEQTDAEQTDAEQTDAEQTDAEPVEATDAAEAQPADAQPTATDPVEAPAATDLAEPAPPKVVTRSRRRAASRPAGPPAAASVDGETRPEAADAEEPHVEHVPIKRKGTRKR